MEVIEAIEHAESDLASTLDELQVAKELVAALEQDAKRIRIELVGLKSYADRLGLSVVPEPSADVVPISSEVLVSAPGGPTLHLMSRSEAVSTVMAAAGEPLDRSSIHERFVDAGRFDSVDDISLSLSGLKRAGRVEKLGQGLWQLAQTTTAAEGR